MSAFIDWLERINERDSRARAVLRRSLAFDPGAHPPAYPYVERFLADDDSSWRRQVHYLVAALWAMHWKDGRAGPALTLAQAFARHALQHHDRDQLDKGGSSTERRFVALLDSDPEQLPHRLRQAVALLKDETIDFDPLLTDLLYWQASRKPTQQKWAREYYREPRPDADTANEATTKEETA